MCLLRGTDWVLKYSSGNFLFCALLTVNMQITAKISIRSVNQSAGISVMGIVRLLVNAFTPLHHGRHTLNLCGLVVRVLATDTKVSVWIPGATRFSA